MLTRLTSFFDTLSNAKRYSRLFAMSDAELAARGLSRDGLTRSYIASLGAQ